MKHTPTAFIVLLTLAGCATTILPVEGTKIEKEQVVRIKPGVTTRREIVSVFGEPKETKTLENTETVRYLFKEKNVNEYLGGMFVDKVNGKVTITVLDVVIKDDRVDSYKYRVIEE